MALTLDAAETWRQRRRQLVEEGLAQVDGRLMADLKTALDVLRESAAELLGELGRRRAREHLRREAVNLVAAQIGRARGDLQYRLSEAGRALAREMEQRYADATGRMRGALQAAEGMRVSSAPAAQEKERGLSEREVAAQHVLTLLGETAGPAGSCAAFSEPQSMP